MLLYIAWEGKIESYYFFLGILAAAFPPKAEAVHNSPIVFEKCSNKLDPCRALLAMATNRKYMGRTSKNLLL